MKTQRDYFVLLAGVLLGLGLMAGTVSPQAWVDWSARYNTGPGLPDYCNDIGMDTQGNIYVMGDGGGAGMNYNYILVKYDSSGQQQWVATYNGPDDDLDETSELALDDWGDILITGLSTDTGGTWTRNTDYCTIKYNPAGQALWVNRFNGVGSDGDEARAIATDLAGNVFVTGYSDQLPEDMGMDYDIVTLKYSSDGARIWQANYGSPENDYEVGTDIAVDSLGHVYLLGISGDLQYPGDYDLLLIKYNLDGQEIWQVLYDGVGHGDDYGSQLALDADGNIYVTGWSDGDSSIYTEDMDFLTAKYDPSGSLVWMAQYDGPQPTSQDESGDIRLDADRNVYIAGESYNDIVIIKYNNDGIEQWRQRFNGPGQETDMVSGLAVDPEGNVYAVGTSDWWWGSWQNFDMVTLKYDASGELLWKMWYDNESEDDYGNAGPLLDSDGNVIVAGTSSATGNSYDISTIKYQQHGPISLALTPASPPIQIPVEGGSFDFTAELSSDIASSYSFEVWVMVQLPDGSWEGPVLGPLDLALPGGGHLTRLRTQNVPSRAPTGTYTYRGYVGHSHSSWDSSSFTFEKLAAGGLGFGASEWSNTGEEFDVGARHASPLPSGSSPTPTTDKLMSAAPNPFNPETTISYQLSANSQVKLEVFDLSGRSVAVLVNGQRDAGVYQVTWDASGLPSGLYFCRLQAGSFTNVIKMMLVK